MYWYVSFQSATGSLCVAISLLARCASAVCQAPPDSCCSRILYSAHGVISYSVVGLSPREEAPQTPPHRQDDASGRKGRHASSPHQIHQFNIIRQFYSLHWSATTRLLHPCSVVLISRVVPFAPRNEALVQNKLWCRHVLDPGPASAAQRTRRAVAMCMSTAALVQGMWWDRMTASFARLTRCCTVAKTEVIARHKERWRETERKRGPAGE